MKPLSRFENRVQAGYLLAERLSSYARRNDVIVVALPRGGVPVGLSVAKSLDVPLEVLLVRKLGVPGHEEYAMGAVAGDGQGVLQKDVLARFGLTMRYVDAMAKGKIQQIRRREKMYRAGRPPLDVNRHIVILVDDGVATGSTMLAAIQVLRKAKPARIIVAVPVAAPDTCQLLQAQVDEVISLLTPEPFRSVSTWYEDFAQTTDEEVKSMLAEADRWQAQRELAHPPSQSAGRPAIGPGAD